MAWLLAIYGLGGLISLVMALYYKTPVTGAYSIPGAALVAGSLTVFSFDQAVGAFIMAGVIVFVLGITGLIGRVMRWLPMPIVMAMIAGALIRFGIGAVTAIGTLPIVVGATVLAFFLSMRLTRVVPPVLSALVVGLIAVWATGSFGTAEAGISFVMPEFTAPHFTLDAFLAIALPLAILVVGAENAQAIGVLQAEGYRPPINAMTVISGVGGVLAGFLGGHNANIAGPMTAICSSDQAGEDKQGRYAATVVNGILFAGFGIFAGLLVPLILMLPAPLIGAVAGLAMINVLLMAFQSAFTQECRLPDRRLRRPGGRHVEHLDPRHQRAVLGAGRRRHRLGPCRSRKPRRETGRVSAGYRYRRELPSRPPLLFCSPAWGAHSLPSIV